MRYNSTRNKNLSVSAAEAIVRGISPDGGLYIPEEFPKLMDLKDLMNMSYRELASYVLGLYFEELGLGKLKESAGAAYDGKFPTEVTPLKTIGDMTFIELYHGRTLAFKDMALSVLPHLLKASLEKLGNENRILILVATSGDTGKAALEGFNEVDGIDVMVYYPKDGVSEVQRLQMVTHAGSNTHVIAIDGNFDDAQSGVKDIFTDEDFKNKIMELGFNFSSANSINIGRLIPQIVYYINAYLRLVEKGIINNDSKINVAVPTGNFGNVLAAYYAKQMGLPINKLIVASNDNKVLTDFFETGEYDKERELLLTSSPSMDILISSNLERLLYHITDGDYKKVSEAMKKLNQNKKYLWDEFGEGEFFAAFASEEDVSNSIREVYDGDYTIDPHTAVAYFAARRYIETTGDKTHMLVASTASPFKFPAKVLSSIGEDVPDLEFDSLRLLSEKMKVEIPDSLKELPYLEIKHKDVYKPDEMRQSILEIIQEKKYVKD
ncbi:threonine synthase [Microaceticoccus formicicus]|uniref:threonine synthase n=1 Tax=Microaceticoccus formicicus TaxID=3118105 RepID=UPI003CD03309|nr:threonine synthase [Peptoniphilaceae bacterium AMB_02]